MVQQNSFTYGGEFRKQQLLSLPLSPADKMLLIVLDAIAGKDEFCCPPLKTLARLMGCSVARVRTAIKTAEQHGYIEVSRLPAHTGQYRIKWEAIEESKREDFKNVNKYL